MKSLNGAAVLAAWSALAVGGAAHAQEAVQWRVEDGGNGHWYQVVVDRRPFTAAAEHAASRSGYLAEIDSAAENEFCFNAASQVPSAWSPSAGGNGPYIGSYRASNGLWQHLSGLPMLYQGWCAGQPDNYGGTQDAATYWSPTGVPSSCWDDVSGLWPNSSLIEWSADCNGDGIVDYGQILDGTFADANGNGVPDTCECFADVNQDGVVNGADISAVLGFWGQAGKPLPAADITRDGLVDGADLAVLLGSWGPCQ